jgi:hypothetical protein
MSLEQMAGFSGKFKESLWPFGLNYAFAWKMDFLCCLNPESLSRHQGPLLVRDGELPLRDFFRAHPEPSSFANGLQLVIGERFAPLVPTSWNSRVRFYRLWEKERPLAAPVSELLLFAHIGADFFSGKDLEEGLKRAREIFGESAFAKLKKSVFFKMFFWEHSLQSPEAAVIEEVMEAGRLLGEDVKVLNFESLQQRSSYEGCAVLDLSPSWFCADNYLTHLALSRGARLLPGETPSRTAEESPSVSLEMISPYHGFKIEEFSRGGEEFRFSPAWPSWLLPWYVERRGMH